MSNWERRDADTLADAIGKHRRRNPHLVEDNQLLAIVQEAVDDAANTISTNAGDLRRHRALVCAICRGSQLYACDVEDGWSENCALICSNTSEFSPL
jgi:hypothetical protein